MKRQVENTNKATSFRTKILMLLLFLNKLMLKIHRYWSTLYQDQFFYCICVRKRYQYPCCIDRYGKIANMIPRLTLMDFCLWSQISCVLRAEYEQRTAQREDSFCIGTFEKWKYPEERLQTYVEHNCKIQCILIKFYTLYAPLNLRIFSFLYNFNFLTFTYINVPVIEFGEVKLL